MNDPCRDDLEDDFFKALAKAAADDKRAQVSDSNVVGDVIPSGKELIDDMVSKLRSEREANMKSIEDRRTKLHETTTDSAPLALTSSERKVILSLYHSSIPPAFTGSPASALSFRTRRLGLFSDVVFRALANKRLLRRLEKLEGAVSQATNKPNATSPLLSHRCPVTIPPFEISSFDALASIRPPPEPRGASDARTAAPTATATGSELPPALRCALALGALTPPAAYPATLPPPTLPAREADAPLAALPPHPLLIPTAPLASAAALARLPLPSRPALAQRAAPATAPFGGAMDADTAALLVGRVGAVAALALGGACIGPTPLPVWGVAALATTPAETASIVEAAASAAALGAACSTTASAAPPCVHACGDALVSALELHHGAAASALPPPGALAPDDPDVPAVLVAAAAPLARRLDVLDDLALFIGPPPQRPAHVVPRVAPLDALFGQPLAAVLSGALGTAASGLGAGAVSRPTPPTTVWVEHDDPPTESDDEDVVPAALGAPLTPTSAAADLGLDGGLFGGI